MNRLVIMMYLFSWSLRFVSLAGERKLTTSNHILYVFCLSHDFFFLYPPTYSLPLDLVCIFGHAFSRMQNPPLEIAITSCHVPFLGETRSTVHSLPTVLMADQRINATQIEIGGALSWLCLLTERCLPPLHPIMRKLTKAHPWSFLPSL